ncbi:MOSC domain-containing protein [Gilvimarinus sp. 1_MG-2023]|uniref:MOSC domain-containing protein n=1 Tax=Gilvimarinus sp. 1_MG-2023 TaxID=3062638 RepID=UPI0026E3E289|nr:MOSC domain-containing protein [Gilvimarinus sp. 1_MG-2023]MDO6746567.1 MOSC domain-containing protein [Gilvimarinus sp. 1_MG-2023]
MQLLSINRAIATDITLGNKTVATGIFKKPTQETVVIGRLGVAGDTIVDTKVHGGEDQAVYLYSAEDYAWWSEQLDRELPAGTFGENLTIMSFHDGVLRVGDRLQIGESLLLEITAPRVPCAKFAAKMGDASFVKAFIRAGRPGAYARVLQIGSVTKGDALKWQPTEQNYIDIKGMFYQWHQKAWDKAALHQALGSPLSKIARRIISKRAGIADSG